MQIISFLNLITPFKTQIILHFTSTLVPLAKKVFGYERSHICTAPYTSPLVNLPPRKDSFSCLNM